MSQFKRALTGLVRRSIDTPAAVVMVDVMQRNIDAMQAFAAANGVDLRPHVKTHKCVEIGCRQLAAGAVGITAGTVGEAEVFADAGVDDIFLAYPIWAAGTKPARLRRLASSVRLRIGTDSAASIERLADALDEVVDRIEIVIEIDCGARRSGTEPDSAGKLAAIARNRGLRPVGVYTYPGQGGSSPNAREQAAREQRTALTGAVRSLESVGVTADVVSAGSTPTVEYSTGGPITEVRPGEYVFYDLDNLRLGDCTADQIALFVAATVVSDQVPDQVILDTGTKALGREGNADKGYGRVATTDAILLDGPDLFRLNEYHGYLVMTPGRRFEPGTVLPVIPNHVCPVVNNFDELLVTAAADADSHTTWPIAARGHLI